MKLGFTTGTCAQAAAAAAGRMLFSRRIMDDLEIETPAGKKLKLKLIGQKIGKDFAQCGVIKDSGDDPDVTDGAKIYARVRFSDVKGIEIKGGKGIGKVTKPGLAVAVGECAINPVPRKMIAQELTPYLTKSRGLKVTLSVPNGSELAKRTFNPQLGILGGISIIGTTGIVYPKSTDAYKASLALQLSVLKATGHKKAVFVLGYVGEKFCREQLKLKPDAFIKIGDHVGFMLDECVKKGIKRVLLIGHIGKLVKVANGQFNTHCNFGDERLSLLADYAVSCRAGKGAVAKILRQKTAEAVIPILEDAGVADKIFSRIAADVSKKCAEFAKGKVAVNCILLSLNGELL